jgi:hypothetical protein
MFGNAGYANPLPNGTNCLTIGPVPPKGWGSSYAGKRDDLMTLNSTGAPHHHRITPLLAWTKIRDQIDRYIR